MRKIILRQFSTVYFSSWVRMKQKFFNFQFKPWDSGFLKRAELISCLTYGFYDFLLELWMDPSTFNYHMLWPMNIHFCTLEMMLNVIPHQLCFCVVFHLILLTYKVIFKNISVVLYLNVKESRKIKWSKCIFV